MKYGKREAIGQSMGTSSRQASAREVTRLTEQKTRLQTQLAEFEQQYDLASDEFYIRFERGELGDATDFVEWSATYEMIQNLEDRLAVLSGEKADEQ